MEPSRESSPTDYLALYGSLMACIGGLERIGATSGLEFIGPCRIQGRLVDLGRYPGLVARQGLVDAELYRLHDPTLLDMLDRFEGYNRDDLSMSLFVRRRIILYEPAGRDAWVYTYNKPQVRAPFVESGSWARHLRNRS